MGQAKQRGSYEERKAAAIKKKQEIQAAMREIERRKPSPKRHKVNSRLAAMMALSMGMSNTFVIKNHDDLARARYK